MRTVMPRTSQVTCRVSSFLVFALLVCPMSARGQSRDFLVLQAPGCEGTIPIAVNERGDVVGIAGACAGGSDSFAFLYRDGSYTNIDFPGATTTTPTGVNDRGVVVGYFRTPDGGLGAFRLWHGEYQTLSVPDVPLVPQGVNNRGDIIGWIPGVPYQSFLLTVQGDFTIFTGEGDLQGLQAWGINSSGLIVGGGFSPSRGRVSFAYREGDAQATVLDLTGGVYAVNDRGDLAAEVPGVGHVVYRHGALLNLKHPETNFTIFDLSNRWVVGTLQDNRGYILRLR